MHDLEELQQTALALERLATKNLNDCIDAGVPKSRPHEGQQELLDDLWAHRFQHYYIQAANQVGKSQILCRLIAWMFFDRWPSYMPQFSRPKEWGTGPLQMMLTSLSHKQIEQLHDRIISFGHVSEWRKITQSGTLQGIEHKTNGNKLLYTSVDNPVQARKRIQGFTLHAAFSDEMPGSHTIVEELHRRVQAKGGWYICSFTPKVSVPAFRNLVDNATAPLSRRYKWHLRMSPLYKSERKYQQVLQSIANLTTEERATILLGEWSSTDAAVFNAYTPDFCIAEFPEHQPGLRHVLGLDPALHSKFGVVLLAEHPATGVWYVVRTEYLSGLPAPSDYARYIKQQYFDKYNIIRTACDTADLGFVGEATKMGITLSQPYEKNNRKMEMIGKVNEALRSGRVKLATWASLDIGGELQSCRWGEEGNGRIVNSHKFHLLDSLRYIIDMLPKPDPAQMVPDTFDAWMLQQDAIWRKKQAAKKSGRMKIRSRW